jgi:TolB-like protein/predicted Ser/Thr protein kinase
MGVVYEAEDLSLGRKVALKFLPDAVMSREALERFKREAQAASALNHPHICVVYDLGEHEGKPFIAMERMQGRTLKAVMSDGPLPVDRVLELGSQLADALEAAHAAGILHRDLKPANVFVTDRGEAKLLDFGLAKVSAKVVDEVVGSEVPTAEFLTKPGSTLGTVAYMSPEQARGEGLDARSDLFSLGVALYEMAAGRLPFAGGSRAEIFKGILADTPAPPTSLNPEVPPKLEEIILKALEKDRVLRYQHAAEMRADLRRLLRDTVPSRASSAGTGRVWPALPSRRGLVLVGAVVAVVALALGGVWLARRGRDAATAPTSATASKRVAVLPFENLGAAEDAYFADGMTDEVRSKLAGLSGLEVIASASASQYKATTKPPEQIAKELGVGYLLVAKVRWQKSGPTSRIRLTSELVDVGSGGAPTTRWQEAYEADLSDVFRVQGEIATKVAQSLEVALSGRERGRLTARPTSNLAAYDAYLKGQEIQKAAAGLPTRRRALAQYEQAVALDPGFALAWAQLSLSHSSAYIFGVPSPQDAEGAKKAAERAMELAPSMAEGHVALGNYHLWVRKDPEKAFDAYARGLNLAPDDALLLRALARAERGRGRWEEALAHLRRARELDPRSWQGERQLAYTLLLLRRTGEAREASDRGLALAPANLTLISDKAMTFLQEGDLAGARAVLAAAPKEVEPTALVAAFAVGDDLHWVLDDAQRDVLLRLTPGAFDGDRGTWGIVLAQAWALRGDQAKAREYAEEARKGFAVQSAEAPQDSGPHVFLGLALAYLGRKAEAVREGEMGVAPWPIATRPFHDPYGQHQLVRIHILVGNHDRALDLLEPLLRVPYHLTPAWLRIDPNFDPLRGNPRFDKLAHGT